MATDFLGSSHYPLALDFPYRMELAECHPKNRPWLLEQIRAATEESLVLGYRPLPMAEKFHRSRARKKIAVGGNRSSKSFALTAEVFFRLTGTHPYCETPEGITAWYASKSFEVVGESLWPMMEKMLNGYDYDPSWISKPDNILRSARIRLDGNKVSKLTYKAYNQGRETFQAAALDVAAFDEQFPQDVYIETTTRIGAGKSLIFMAAMTPIMPQGWWEETLRDPPDGMEVFEFPLDHNRISVGGFIRDEEIDAAIASWPIEIVETRRRGKWGSYVGAVYKSFSRGVHVRTPEQEKEFFPDGKIHRDTQVVESIDFGAGNSPFCCGWFAKVKICGEDAWYLFDEYRWLSREKGDRLMRDHAKEILSRREKWNANVRRTWADPEDLASRNELRAAEVPTNASKKDVTEGIEAVQTFLKVSAVTKRPRFFIASRCKTAISEMATYRWQEGTENKDAKVEPVKKDDHLPDLIRYCLHSERVSEPPVAQAYPLGNFAYRH